ncbi:META domain-containing protein [Halopseudomonas xiamenensis]|uniref:META domain-containing protein n=1 Tax=Halopseudomonas xiamenensis TaxID=157792 RepID=UPI001624316A|nr:META domain-containing protein [Halopseudomonas xiamenensis]
MHFSIPTLALAATLGVLAGCAAGTDQRPAASMIESEGFSTQLQCGRLPVSASGQGEQLQVEVNGEQFAMRQAISASGARYVADTEEETSLWFKGEQAWLVLRGDEYPLCAPAGSIIEPFRASGNEPFWSLTLEQGLLSLNRLNEGELPAQPYVTEERGQVSTDGAHPVSLRVTEQLCRDSMSGMPFPQRASVQVDGATLEGCGGDPARLLQGGEWVVEDIDGRGIIDRSRVTLNFWRDGRVTGRASCNNFMGQYQLTGEGLGIGQTATTRMACAPSLMEQEQRVLRNLENLQGFDFDDSGALLLRAGSGSFKARLEN